VNQCSSHWRIHVAILGISNPSRKTPAAGFLV
jgi:hypothetical protein